jgi:hypothetical protein
MIIATSDSDDALAPKSNYSLPTFLTEIREMIYHFLFPSPLSINGNSRKVIEDLRVYTSLLKTCSQRNDEAAPILYHSIRVREDVLHGKPFLTS